MNTVVRTKNVFKIGAYSVYLVAKINNRIA